MRTNSEALALAGTAILAVAFICLGVILFDKWDTLLAPIGGIR